MNFNRKKKLAENLHTALPKADGQLAASLKHKIAKLEAMPPAECFSMASVLSRDALDAQLDIEEQLLSEYERIQGQGSASEIKMDGPEERLLSEIINFTNSRLYHLKNECKNDYSGPYSIFSKVSALLELTVVGTDFDPGDDIHYLEIYVNRIRKMAIDLSAPKRQAEVIFRDSTNIELLLLDEKMTIVYGLAILPSEFFVDRGEGQFSLQFGIFNFLELCVRTSPMQVLRRSSNEYRCLIKKGHALEKRSNSALVYCNVCSKRCPLFKCLYECIKCGVKAHARCADYIFFKCRGDASGNAHDNAYDIAHAFEESGSAGMQHCKHCGEWSVLGLRMLRCNVCGCYCHERCSAYAFNDCGLEYELRVKMAEFEYKHEENEKEATSTQVDDFKHIRVTGRGSFGKVMVSEHRSTGEVLALKVIKKQKINSQRELDCISTERRILKKITDEGSPFFAQMRYFFQDSHNIYFGLEYHAGGDLLHHVLKQNFSEQQIQFYTTEIVAALEFLHKNNIAYRDLKLDNILLSRDGHVKLCDFGLSKMDMDDDAITYTFCGTLDTVAPEILTGGGYLRSVDFWSLGIIVYEMFHKQPPFVGSDPKELVNRIYSTAVLIKTEMSLKAKDFIERLLLREPKMRLGYGSNGMHDIKAHAWFSDIDWERVGRAQPELVPGDTYANFDEKYTEMLPIITPSTSIASFSKHFAEQE